MTDSSYLHTTRDGYDAIAASYAEHFRTVFKSQPFDLAMLEVFAQVVRAGGGGRVVEVGSGPGWVTAHLHELGLDVSGLDLSPEMVALARRTYPELRFDEGVMGDLDLADGALAGLVAWYSVIHVPRELLPAVFTEFHRVLAPGGQLLLAFQVGDDALRLTEAFGQSIALDFHRLRPERVGELLAEAGFTVRARLTREPESYERTQQAYLLAHKPAGDDAPAARQSTEGLVVEGVAAGDG